MGEIKVIADPFARSWDATARFLADQGIGVNAEGKLTRAEYRRQKHGKKATYQYTAEQIEQIRRQARAEAKSEFLRTVCPGCAAEIRGNYEKQLYDLKLTCLNLVLATALKILWQQFGFRTNRKMDGRLQKFSQAMIYELNEGKDLHRVIKEVEELTGIELVVRNEDDETVYCAASEVFRSSGDSDDD
jgi:hypothetical protein